MLPVVCVAVPVVPVVCVAVPVVPFVCVAVPVVAVPIQAAQCSWPCAPQEYQRCWCDVCWHWRLWGSEEEELQRCQHHPQDWGLCAPATRVRCCYLDAWFHYHDLLANTVNWHIIIRQMYNCWRCVCLDSRCSTPIRTWRRSSFVRCLTIHSMTRWESRWIAKRLFLKSMIKSIVMPEYKKMKSHCIVMIKSLAVAWPLCATCDYLHSCNFIIFASCVFFLRLI